jgi:predicted nucleic-acid-binding protein
VRVIGIDTNVLVRYFTQDDPGQYQQAAAVIQADDQTCFLSNIVLCELVWVLKRAYKSEKTEICNLIELLMQTPKFELENQSAVYQALQRYQAGRADFSDYLIGVIAHGAGCVETVTFDKKLLGEKGFQLLND